MTDATAATQVEPGASEAPVHTRAVIIGTGFSGLGMAIALQRQGVDFVILEKADDIGGTWRDNSYPGCACDIPSHLYSYSFEPKPDWKNPFSYQPEIWDYLKGSPRSTGCAATSSSIPWSIAVTGTTTSTAGMCSPPTGGNTSLSS